MSSTNWADGELFDATSGSLNPAIYTDPAIYERELEQVFGRSWLFLAHDSQLTKTGSFLQTYMGEDPILVVRQRDGSVKAFLNQCRHRGMRICRSDEGTSRTLRTYELRVYTLATEKALTAYLDVHYPRHQVSLPRFGIAVHGFWSAVGTGSFQLYVLVSYPEGADPAELNQRYMSSPDIAEDMVGFERSDILDVTSTLLAPAAGSPLL